MSFENATSKFFKEFIEHKKAVSNNINLCLRYMEEGTKSQSELLKRSLEHDNSKVNNTLEYTHYIQLNIDLIDVKYGSPQYIEVMKKHAVAIEEHYANNSHHPEHYKNGILDMSYIDLIEMVADWVAVIKVKGLTDKLEENLLVNKKRFNIDDELYEKILNTAKYMVDINNLPRPNLLQLCDEYDPYLKKGSMLPMPSMSLMPYKYETYIKHIINKKCVTVNKNKS